MVLTEIVSLHDPAQCLPMVQYAAELNDNIGKLTFLLTCTYDIKFCLKKQIKPSTPWNVIENHLWSKCFSGVAKDTSYHPNHQGGSNSHFQKTCDDFNYWSCTRAKCKFQHKCSKCFRTGYNQCHCHNSGNHNQSSTSFTTSRVNLSAGHSNQVSDAR